MSHEQTQRYFQGAVTVIANALSKDVKKKLLAIDPKKFRTIERNFGDLSITENNLLSDIIRFSCLLIDLQMLIDKPLAHFPSLSQTIANAKVLLNCIYNKNPALETYAATLQRLYYFEQTASIPVLNQLGIPFIQLMGKLRNVQTPTWDVLEKFKTELQKHNQSAELKIHFDPIISFLEKALPANSHETPMPDKSSKNLMTLSQ